MKRQPLSKRTRFSVFTRDGFTCRYCGKQSDTVPLVVDHIIPVCQGGTNDIENLATSCVDCNQGKAGKTIAQHAPNETDRLRLAQDMHEQRAAALSAKICAKARNALRSQICDYFCEARGQDAMNKRTLTTLMGFVQEFGSSLVYEWIDKASYRLIGKPDCRVGAYIAGIRKHYIEETLGGVAPQKDYGTTLR